MKFDLKRIKQVRIILDEHDDRACTYVRIKYIEARHVPEQREYDVIEAIATAAGEMIASVAREQAAPRAGNA